MMQVICKLICIGGVLALFGVYAFANPDLKTPAGEEGPIHCFIVPGNVPTQSGVAGDLEDALAGAFDLGAWDATCTPCRFPYVDVIDSTGFPNGCQGTDVTNNFLMLMMFGFIVNALPILAVFSGCFAMK